MSFTLAWFVSLIVLIAAFVLVGRVSQNSSVGLLIDSRERFSLTHLQLSLWTLLVLATLVAAFVSSGFDSVALDIPEELLILMGISVGSATAAEAVKSVKDAPGSNAEVKNKSAKFSQVYLEEEGKQANAVISISKFQNFVLTLVAAFAYVVLTLQAQDYPTLPSQLLWLIGIGQAGYVAGKIPNVR
jgi:hypothetical protein